MRTLPTCIAILILGLTGCIDGATVALLLTRKSKKNSSAPAALPDPLYHVWIASIPDVPTAQAQEQLLRTNSGAPDTSVWADVGTGSASEIFAPPQAPGSYNAILIQASSAQTYHLDAVEILDANDTTVETASGTVYENLLSNNPNNMLGPPDALSADTMATAGTNACLFTIYLGPISRFRVTIQSAAPAPGDVLGVSQIVRPGNQKPGGAAFDSTGNIFVTFDEPAGASRTVFLAKLDPTGALLSATSIVTGVTATAGSHCAALYTDDTVYVAATTGSGSILARRYSADLSTQLWSVSFSSGLNSDRVEAHGLAVDSAGNAVVAGGANTVTNGIDPWMRKLGAAAGGTLWTQTQPLLSPDPNSTWWHGVVTDPSGDVYSTGNLGSLATSAIELLTRKSSGAAGTATWSNQFSDPDTPPDTGQAVGLDGSGNVYVGGSLGTSSQGKNAFLIKYSPAGFAVSFETFDGGANLDDEILGLAVESDGTVYAVGYLTLTGPLQVMWIRKFDPTGAIVWTRTYASAGNAQAIDVLLNSTSITVIGFETLAGGETDIHVRRYAK